MAFPKKIQIALEADRTDMISSWVALLNSFAEFQTELSLPEKLTIYYRCEDLRIFWNSDRREPYLHTRNSGEIVQQIKYIKSLNIDISDIKPNNVYNDQDLIEYFQTDADNINQILIKNTKQTGNEEFLFDPSLAAT